MGDWPIAGAPIGTPANILGTTGAQGVAQSVVATDATIPAFDDSGTPTASAPGDIAADGALNFASRKDHRHARESFGTPGKSTPGDSISGGSSAALARADHQHGREDIVFYDDFLYNMRTSPTAGADGLWTTGAQGAGGDWGTFEADTDLTAFGVIRLFSNTGLGSIFGIHMWGLSPTVLPITLAPGLEIGFRIRRDATDFTQAVFVCAISNGGAGDTGATRRIRFVLQVDAAAAPPTDVSQFDATDTSQSPTSIILSHSTSASYTSFRNVKMVVVASQDISCFVDGALIGSLAGVQVPSSTTKLALQFYQGTFGAATPGATQKSYIDRVYLDVSRVNRGSN